ncbi:MAG: hypothetical protein KDD82_15180 [Planctomycetes bacterium]|nr:hypothetical protein [Planctomycetota bacterium]
MSPRERQLALVTGAIVGVALISNYVVAPVWQAWREQGATLRDLEGTLEGERGMAERLRALAREREVWSAQLTPPPGGLVQELVAVLPEESKLAGFEPESVDFVGSSPLGNDPDSPYLELRFEVDAKVTLAQLQTFLQRLTRIGRPLRVDRLAVIPPSGKEGASKTLEVQLSLVALTTAGERRGS